MSVFDRFKTFYCVTGRYLSLKFIIITGRKSITDFLNYNLKKVKIAHKTIKNAHEMAMNGQFTFQIRKNKTEAK
jgi:hypothetical protein